VLALLPVQAGVDADAVEPGGEFRFSAKTLESAVRLDEDLLRQIFGIAGRAGHAKGDAWIMR